MSDDRSIHDLLETAVRDLSPVTPNPERAVLARARRDTRRSVLLTVAATMAVVLGGAGVLNVVDIQTRATAPATGLGDGPTKDGSATNPPTPTMVSGLRKRRRRTRGQEPRQGPLRQGPPQPGMRS